MRRWAFSRRDPADMDNNAIAEVVKQADTGTILTTNFMGDDSREKARDASSVLQDVLAMIYEGPNSDLRPNFLDLIWFVFGGDCPRRTEVDFRLEQKKDGSRWIHVDLPNCGWWVEFDKDSIQFEHVD